MQNLSNQVSDEEFESLPDIAWLLVLVALVPHLVALVGTTALAMISSCACFPVSMGPFAIAHTYLLINRLGFTSHISWISAVSFSLVWSAFLYWSWRKNRTVTIAIGAFCFIVAAGWIWLLIAPAS